jgi:hypothetical protein
MHPSHLPSRRELLTRAANGFGAVALAALLAEDGRAAPDGRTPVRHHPAKAKSVIFLYMDGGPSQVDTFDHKPALAKYHGKDPKSVFTVEPTQFNNVGTVMQSPWKFARRGESGRWVSELFPEVAKCVDDLAFIHSMTSKFPEHTSANYFLHTGSGLQGRPSMGAWLTYGLGSEGKDLPGFVVLNGGLIPPGGLDNFNSGFLPAAFQGSVFRPGKEPVANIDRREPTDELQRGKLALLRKLDASVASRYGKLDELESAVANYETAYRMQSAVPELTDLSKESDETKRLYGLEAAYPHTRTFAAECLIARRLVERGVRFIQIYSGGAHNDENWDAHGDLVANHTKHAGATDQPIAALLTDLKRRGLLDSTLVVWGGEFGRQPTAEYASGTGRDHNAYGFTMWLAGGGIKGGVSVGETDELGAQAVTDRFHVKNLHATILQQLGFDPNKLAYFYNGLDQKLVGVEGAEPITKIIA